jgi:hypothetical protein
MLKLCSLCEIEKNSSGFNKKANGSLQGYCKDCNKKYHKDHYDRNKVSYKKKAKDYKQKLIDTVTGLKNKPCTDCGIVYPPHVMDFDHLEGVLKIANVSRMTRELGFSLDTIEKEIEKCELVCANCHRDRTFRRRNKKIKQ